MQNLNFRLRQSKYKSEPVDVENEQVVVIISLKPMVERNEK
jgi:hypothetical protein